MRHVLFFFPHSIDFDLLLISALSFFIHGNISLRIFCNENRPLAIQRRPNTAPIPLSHTLKSTNDIVTDSCSHTGAQAVVENNVTEPHERGYGQAAKDGTPDRWLSSYVNDEQKGGNNDPSQHFEAEDIQEIRITSLKVLNDQENCRSAVPDYTANWKKLGDASNKTELQNRRG